MRMAENLGRRPSKGILKTSSSFEKSDVPKPKYKETKWDEINILATLHPPDKDYGHTKIDEPKTPYNYWEDGETHSGDEADALDADVLADRIQRGANMPPKIMMQEEIDEEESEEEDYFPRLSEEERAKRILFDAKRKAHYNEFQAIKLARKLMEREEEDEDDEEEESDNNQRDGGDNGHNTDDKPSSSSSATN